MEEISGSWTGRGVVTDEGGTVLGVMTGRGGHSRREEEHLTSLDRLEKFASPILSDIDVTVVGEGRVSNGTVRIGSVPLRVGRKITLIGPGYEVQTVITGVTTETSLSNAAATHS